MKTFTLLFLTVLSFTSIVGQTVAQKVALQAEDARLESSRVQVVDQESFPSKKGVSLADAAESNVDAADAPPDIVFNFSPEKAARYVFQTHAAVDEAGKELMARGKTKHDSIFLRMAIGDQRPTKRVVFVPWSAPESCTQTLGNFDLTSQSQEIKIWLPKHVRLDHLTLSPYVAPKVPAEAAKYQPKIKPPSSRPRVWVNAETLPQVRANLTRGENAPIWEAIKESAARPFTFKPEPGAAVEYNVPLETAVVDKAFVYLMTGDEHSGREAVTLVRDYLAAVEFGNLLDITREIGRAIYAGAQVYDWCYDLMTPEDRESIRSNMMRLADEMEIGWPPFRQSVVNGHGSEGQLLCYLLSMAIAIYDEDPLPYQYCAYRILEEHVPMRNFEYQSPRHNQGIGYGIYRFSWDMHAAWLMYRMSGQKVYDKNLDEVHKYWLYMLMPDGASFSDGDGTAYGGKRRLGTLALLTSAYTGDPIMKSEFLAGRPNPADRLLTLLLNDPGLKAVDDYSSLPLTLDFGRILGGMVARTGWNMGEGSSDVVAFLTGGGYYFGNHQHADAGSFQLYYRGVQVADLGQYVFYGTPYDMNFTKRSISHSLMLAHDPNEVFGGRGRLNDGGQRFAHQAPRSPKQVQNDPKFANGIVLSASFGPDAARPDFSYFSVDVTSAFRDKIRGYVRSFCFLNLQNEKIPAVLVVVDHMETSSPKVTKYWQVNTLTTPTLMANGAVLTNSAGDKTGKVFMQMLKPDPSERKTQLLSGADVHKVDGEQLVPPQPEAVQANGHRLVYSPATAQTTDTFVTVLTVADGDQTTAAVAMAETPEAFVLTVEDRIVVMSKTGALITKQFDIEVAGEGETHVVLTGLQEGSWQVAGADGRVNVTGEAVKDKNTISAKLPGGRYTISPF